MTFSVPQNKISIVVATYNRRSTLPRCLTSILQQTHGNFEIIVVDDGSHDGTEKLFETEFVDDRIRYIKLPDNQGASRARNHGIESVQGEFILVWDSDDELYPHALETILEIFKAHPEADIVSSPAEIYAHGKEIPYEYVPKGFVSLSEILCKKLPNNEKVRIVRKNCFDTVRYQSRNLDFMVNGRLAKQGKWYHIDIPLGILHTQRNDSLTQRRKKQNISMSIERSGYLVEYLHEFGSLLQEACKTRYAALSYGAAVGLLLAGKQNDAHMWAEECVKNDPRFFRHRLIDRLSRISYGTVLLRSLFRIMEF